jgi:hypothetical protein
MTLSGLQRGGSSSPWASNPLRGSHQNSAYFRDPLYPTPPATVRSVRSLERRYSWSAVGRVRTRGINWLQGFTSKTLHHRLGKPVRRALYAPTDVGPAIISQLMARPEVLRKLPRSLQNRLRKRAVRPAGARWLVKRLENVPLLLGRSIESATVSRDRLKIRLSDRTARVVDHLLLGTGYRIDISRYAFLDPKLIAAIKLVNGFPVLTDGLETSLRGLHILGAPAAWSFGPLMQFVSGTTYASRSLVRHISRTP